MVGPSQKLALVCLLVETYDDAIEFYCNKLGFTLAADEAQDDKRWVVVSPPGGMGASLLLAEAKNNAERARIGDQTGGRVFLFLNTSDFTRDHARMQAAGVVFLEDPRHEPFGTVAVFEDLYGNKWDLIEPKP